MVKTPIPGTDWIRVKTTQGNLFYSHKVDKKSIWAVPDEIKDAVAALEKQEQENIELDSRRQEEDNAKAEVERIKAQLLKETAKRKAQDPVPVDEVVISKKARVEDDEDEEMDDESEESEEEEWQKEAAAQLEAEAEEEAERRKVEEEEEKLEAEAARKAEEEAKKNPRSINMPTRADLSLEEGKALFKVEAAGLRPSHWMLIDLISRFY